MELLGLKLGYKTRETNKKSLTFNLAFNINEVRTVVKECLSQTDIEVVFLSWGHSNWSSVFKSSCNLQIILLENRNLSQNLAPDVFIRISCMFLTKIWSEQMKDEKFKVLMGKPLWCLKQNGNISSYAFLQHTGVLSILSWNITEHLRHSFFTPEILFP